MNTNQFKQLKKLLTSDKLTLIALLEGGFMTASEISNETGISRTMLTNVMDKLFKTKSIIGRNRQKADKRKRPIELTSKGKKQALEINKEIERILQN